MHRHIKARIQWLSIDKGGRRILPSGPQYSTVARFEDAANEWPNAAWSIIAEFNEPPQVEMETMAIIQFLVAEAPIELLHLGSRFDLLEGERVVAQGQVIE